VGLKNLDNKTKFFLRNLSRGLIWLSVIVIGFVVFKKYVTVDFFKWLKPVLDKPTLVYSIYLGSEIIFGIIPPELFMIWGLQSGSTADYIFIVALLATLSYGAGVLGFLFGSYLQNTRLYRIFRVRVLRRYEEKLLEYGLFLILVAAITPLPFSGISMLVGAVKFPIKRFLLFSLASFLRFAAYSWVIWEANVML
jgi:membrane protein DedA with SNARE-associated domain